jgi:hypothetical protein
VTKKSCLTRGALGEEEDHGGVEEDLAVGDGREQLERFPHVVRFHVRRAEAAGEKRSLFVDDGASNTLAYSVALRLNQPECLSTVSYFRERLGESTHRVLCSGLPYKY